MLIFRDRSFKWALNYYFAKFLEILTTGSLEIRKFVPKQSVRATAHALHLTGFFGFGKIRKLLGSLRRYPISFPELRSPWPAVGKRELWEQPLWKNKGNNRILVIRLTAHLHLWRMPEMVAPRALVFRPLVKGNEALGTRLVVTFSNIPLL